MDIDGFNDFHPLVQKGLLEGRIDPKDAKWLSEYANTPGSSKIETGKKYPDQSERMENYINNVKKGAATGTGFKEGKLELKGISGMGGGADLEGPFKMGTKRKPDYKKGGKVSSASKRADGCCVKGKTKGRMV